MKAERGHDTASRETVPCQGPTPPLFRSPLFARNSPYPRKPCRKHIVEADKFVLAFRSASWIPECCTTIRYAEIIVLELKPKLVTFQPAPARIHPSGQRGVTKCHCPILCNLKCPLHTLLRVSSGCGRVIERLEIVSGELVFLGHLINL